MDVWRAFSACSFKLSSEIGTVNPPGSLGRIKMRGSCDSDFEL
jgi:hypothetical protein